MQNQRKLYLEQKKSGTVVVGKKVGRNDPCPCGSERNINSAAEDVRIKYFGKHLENISQKTLHSRKKRDNSFWSKRTKQRRDE